MKSGENEPVSFSEAARIAGVSRAALSFIINNRPGVSEATRARVKEVLERIGYEPAPLNRRRGVRKSELGKIHRVGILIVGFRSQSQMSEHAKVFWMAVSKAADEIRRRGAKPEFIYLPDPKDPPAALAEVACQGWIGIGHMPEPEPWPAEWRERLNPVVWMPCAAGLGWGDSVGINQETTGLIAAHYLYARGARTAAVVGLLNTRPIRTRTDSFTQRFQQLGGEIVQVRPLNQFFTRQRTPNLLAVDIVLGDVVKSSPVADGIFVSSDCFMPEVYRQLIRSGLRPCEDMQIIGCSNEREYLRALVPTPATIDIRAEDIATRAVQQLWWRRQHPHEERTGVVLEPWLVLPDGSHGPAIPDPAVHSEPRQQRPGTTMASGPAGKPPLAGETRNMLV